MGRLFYIMAAISVFMVLIAGSGAVLISKTIVAQSKVDAVSTTAKSIALALSEQVSLLSSLLEKMTQDSDVKVAIKQNKPELFEAAAKKLENHFPGILSVKFLLPDSKDSSKAANPAMSFADLQMARKTFETNQQAAIQGDINVDRHLAIARKITENNATIGVVLASVNYDFIARILSATPLEKGYIELRQGKLVLATTGKKNNKDEIDNPPVQVPGTDWELYYDNANGGGFIELSLLTGIILIPALIVVLAFVTGYRKISDLITDDTTLVIKAFKDIVTEKPLGEYPVKLSEMSRVISTLSQFKRIVSEKLF